MNSCLIQLKEAYETAGLSPEQIAEDQELDITAVKAGLMQCSAKYRKDCGLEQEKEDRLNFSDYQLERVNEKLFELALSAETSDGKPDHRTQAMVCQYIRDDKKGRKEVVKQLGNNTFNILTFNDEMKKVREKVGNIKKALIAA